MKYYTMRNLSIIAVICVATLAISAVLLTAFDALDKICQITMIVSLITLLVILWILPKDDPVDEKTKKEYINKLTGNYFEAKIKDTETLEDFISMSDIAVNNVKCTVRVNDENKLTYNIQINVEKTTEDFEDVMKFLDNFEII